MPDLEYKIAVNRNKMKKDEHRHDAPDFSEEEKIASDHTYTSTVLATYSFTR